MMTMMIRTGKHHSRSNRVSIARTSRSMTHPNQMPNPCDFTADTPMRESFVKEHMVIKVMERIHLGYVLPPFLPFVSLEKKKKKNIIIISTLVERSIARC